MLKELDKYYYKSITTHSPNFSAIFSSPKVLIDEGNFYRLNELNIIEKNNIVNVKVDDISVVIEYMNGKIVELGIAVLRNTKIGNTILWKNIHQANLLN